MIRVLVLVCAMASLSMAREPQTVKVERSTRVGDGVEVKQGSGVLAGSSRDGTYRVVLSVAHVAGARGQRVRVHVNNKWHQGQVVGADSELDAALIVINGKFTQGIPSARLWLGDVWFGMPVRTEGFPAGRFKAVTGTPTQLHGRHIVGTGGVRPGTSGGPMYVVSSTHSASYLSLASHSDFHTVQSGPYRNSLKRFVETCSTQSFGFDMNRRGTIDMVPRAPRRLDVPLVIPEERPQRPEMESNQELMDELKQLLQARESATVEATMDASSSAPEPQPTPAAMEGDIITLQIPLRLKIRVEDERKIYVEQVE